jgi:inhibitor of cysteine peptidase
MVRGIQILVAAALFVGAGCGGSPAVDSAPERFDDPKGGIAVDAGTEFEIGLASNPSTGYGWKVEVPKGGVLEHSGSDYQPDPEAGDRVGAGGTEVLSFRAQGAGKASIDLEYVGPGRDAEVAERRTIEVTVR